MQTTFGVEVNPALSGGLGETKTMSIRGNAKAFRILIDGLYSNKILACVRETLSNAFDSMVRAGKGDQPFQVKLPTKWEPAFSVRDFGVSMTHEFVMNTYSNVFDSDKDKSNDEVGGFGLGKMTPLIVGDAFGLTCWLDGKRRTYNVFMDNGIPSIALFDEEDSDEPQGCEVSFPVDAKDVHEFEVAANRVALGLPVAPKCNVELRSFTDAKPILAGNGWRLYKSSYDLGFSGLHVRVGCVLYPVNRNSVDQNFLSFAEESIILDMPIGSVAITPSRETIAYDDTTKKNLNAALKAISTEFVTAVTKPVIEATTFYEAVVLRAQLRQTISSHNLNGLIDERCTWRGKRIGKNIPLTLGRVFALKRRGLSMDTVHFKRGKVSPNVQTLGSTFFENGVFPQFVYYEGEFAPSFFTYRLQSAQRRLGFDMILLRNFKPGSVQETLLWLSLGRPPRDKLRFNNLMEFDFEKPNYSKTLADILIWSDRSDKLLSKDRLSDSSVPRMDGTEDRAVFWIDTFKGEPVDSSNYRLRNMWDGVRELGLVKRNAVLIGIPASRKDMIKKLPAEWLNVRDYFNTLLEVNLDLEKLAHAMAYKELNDYYNTRRLFDQLDNIEPLIRDPASLSLRIQLARLPLLDGCDEDRAFQIKLWTLAEEFLPADEKAAIHDKLVLPPLDDMFQALIKEHKTAYPLLHKIGNISECDYVDIANYINDRDAAARHDALIQEREDAQMILNYENEGGYVPSDFSSNNVISVDFCNAA